MTVFSRDITDERERERERRRFENAVEHAGHAIFITDTDGTIEYVNPAFEAVTGFDEQEALGENPRILKSGELSEKYYERLWETITAGEVWQEQIINHRKSGERYVADQTIAPFERDGEITGYVAIQNDITDRKRRENEHQRLAGEYEALLDSSGDAIFLLDVDTSGEEPRFEFARLSPGYETQTGLSTEEVKGRTPRDVFGQERGAELHANYSRCVEAGEPISYREELAIAEDAQFWDTSLAPVIVGDELVRIVGIARNVTEQVERERALETTNQRLESLIEATPLTVMEIDTDGTVIRWNEGAEEMFGWSREAVLGEPNPIIPEQKASEFSSHRERALGGDRIRGKEVQRERKDGTELEALLSVVPIEGPDGEITSVLAVLEDISAQKRLERKLRSLQETAQRLTGAQSDEEIGDLAIEAIVEILGFDVTAIWKYSEQANALVPLAESDAARDVIGEAPRFAPGESLAWDAFEAGEVQVHDDLSAVNTLHNAETRLSSELLVPVGDYGVLSAASVTKREFADADVDLFRILGSTVEAAFARASREAELKRQNERLDEFASVVAHDLRNPLSVAIGFQEVIEQTGELEYLDRIGSAHERMERLIEDLLTLASGESTIENTEQIDLEALTTEAWGYVDTDGASLDVSADVPTVAGDAGRLTQLFENLFRNAVEHGGPDVAVVVGPLDDGGFYVEDDGPGIPPERRDEVFEHGVTYSDGGTGFGLSIVADIANAHGWTVSVTEGTDGGARFEFVMSE
ncbi:PAS domain-containing sensor histidine kinase [Halorhabdus salina]|uniref:PAS domain-containing sensor histidine kinase n=1 Tax=Halorhabdus salina TaxID=2750670 RepID=UPI0035A878D8